ncbi:hypothetical protein FFLO_07046 [Filobasidium floriforme]|uniref:Peroxidase n=1 Tax=Filobasidium floriforme TaxID=5210 RepID=A0A8K0JG55_9TREE|nr:hypothetical protein FFLO_07046 [Filobasidium floriforme]
MQFIKVTLLTALVTSAFTVAEPNIAALRTLMTDSRFVGLVAPCTVGGSTRTTAAEWLRTAFHDAGSYDHAAGTGGIDGSIAFETTRSENAGLFLTATINQYRTFQQEGVTLADMVVLGAITAVGACGGPVIPFHAGRLDAASAAIEGRLPLPEETTETHLQKFARMGFSPQEMVTLVACGHSIGGVHGTNTPLVTSARIAPFDSSRTVFDNAVAKEYASGQTINSLGQHFDPTAPNDPGNLARSSDSRTFSVDGNATINRYAASQDAFFTDCVSSFGRMFNDVVPAGTSLTPAIVPYTVNIGMLITLRNEKLNLQSGSARVYDMAGKYRAFEITYVNRDGSPGSNANMLFRTAVDPVSGISALKAVLTMNDGSTFSSPEGTETLKIDDTILVDQGAAFTCKHSNGGINITVAVLGPYDPKDKVEIIWDKVSDPTRTSRGESLLADYRRARPDTPYNVRRER